MRVKFLRGKQREFIKKVMVSSRCPSLRALKQFGFNINYSTLKSYYNENRTLPKSLFLDLCYLAGINPASLKINIIDENWGQKKGGRR